MGTINPIDPDGKGPGTDVIPEGDKTNGRLDGNLYEPGWVKDSKLVPSAEITKNPYVGVGKQSEESYIYVYVKNTMKNNDHVYFDIDTTNWEGVQPVKTADKAHFTGGLFRYKETLKAETENKWTRTPLFEKIKVDNNAVAEDFTIAENGKGIGSIQVFAYIHQARDQKGNDLKKVSQDAAIDAIPTFKVK